MEKKILLIDDDVELCQEFTEILTDEGYSVQTAYNGIEGQKRIKEDVFDIIVIDYKMPSLGGIGLLKFIKERDLKAKIFLMSGKPFVEKLVEGENLSGLEIAILHKPFNPAALLEKINTP